MPDRQILAVGLDRFDAWRFHTAGRCRRISRGNISTPMQPPQVGRCWNGGFWLKTSRLAASFLSVVRRSRPICSASSAGEPTMAPDDALETPIAGRSCMRWGGERRQFLEMLSHRLGRHAQTINRAKTGRNAIAREVMYYKEFCVQADLDRLVRKAATLQSSHGALGAGRPEIFRSGAVARAWLLLTKTRGITTARPRSSGRPVEREQGPMLPARPRRSAGSGDPFDVTGVLAPARRTYL